MNTPAQSMVLGIQAKQSGLVSNEFVQENFEGINDVDLERRRIDIEQMRELAFARLMEGMQSGEVSPKALVEMARARANGDDIFELFDEYVVQPQEDRAATELTSGFV